MRRGRPFREASVLTGGEIVLDLYCGEGGASVGFALAGCAVIGVDLNDDERDRRARPRPKPLKRYPFPAVEGCALAVLRRLLTGEAVLGFTLDDFAAIHASPPCQKFSPMTRVNGRRRDGTPHVDLITPTRELLLETGLPYVIENVPEAAEVMSADLLLCGSMFDPPMDVKRHRIFEANWPLAPPTWPCRHKFWYPRFRGADYRHRTRGRLMTVVPVYGGTRYAGDHELRRRAMGIEWMTSAGLTQAIPPAYAEFVGRQLLDHLRSSRAAA